MSELKSMMPFIERLMLAAEENLKKDIHACAESGIAYQRKSLETYVVYVDTSIYDVTNFKIKGHFKSLSIAKFDCCGIQIVHELIKSLPEKNISTDFKLPILPNLQSKQLSC